MTRPARWIALALLAAPGLAQGQLVGSGVSPIGGDSTVPSFNANGTGSSTSGSLGGTNVLGNTQAFRAPTISALDPTLATPNGFLSSTNAFNIYYANPSFAGRAGALPNTEPGGFGGPLFGNQLGGIGLGTNTNAFSAAAGATALGSGTGFGGNVGTNSQFGGTGSFGGLTGPNQFGGRGGNNNAFGGGGNNNRNFNQQQGQVGGVIVPLPVPIAYTAKLMFAGPTVTAPAMVAEVRQMIDRSNSIARPGAIDVFTDGSVVVLRGTVASEQESDTAAGMVALTPGVLEVRNELKVDPAVAARTPAP